MTFLSNLSMTLVYHPINLKMTKNDHRTNLTFYKSYALGEVGSGFTVTHHPNADGTTEATHLMRSGLFLLDWKGLFINQLT